MTLIHIPLDLYSVFLQPILKVLLPPSQGPNESPTALALDGRRHRHGFLNISVTPIECSIVCNSAWAESVFKPAIRRLPEDQARTVAISKDTYVALSVHTAGLDAGSRVADLTSPLALMLIPLFFITTYYCDFILVPTEHRQSVVKTLLGNGFMFSEDDQSRLVSPLPDNPSPTTYSYATGYGPSHGHGYGHSYEYGDSHHSRATSQGSNHFIDVDTPPSPPPPDSPNPPLHSDVLEALQRQTFSLLRKRKITPLVIPNLSLVQCTGVRGAGLTDPSTRARSHHTNNSSATTNTVTTCWVDTIDTKLYTAVVSALATQPRFLSLTLAHEDPPSLLLDRALLSLFGDALIGPITITTNNHHNNHNNHTTEGREEEEGALIPIFLDLADLPFEATGIVSGVAGRLVKELEMRGVGGSGELSYLSTARAGAVVLERAQAGEALDVLRGLLEGGEE